MAKNDLAKVCDKAYIVPHKSTTVLGHLTWLVGTIFIHKKMISFCSIL